MQESDFKGENRIELEDQFILRLPEEHAEYLRKTMRTKSKKSKKCLSIDLDIDARKGVLTVNKQELHAKLVDLPTVVESNKTTDKVNIFKSADISQMLVCQEQRFEETDKEKENQSKINLQIPGKNRKNVSPHGICQPLKNVKKYRFRKTLRNRETLEESAADIEKEVLWLLRMDNEAVSTKYEIVIEKQNTQDAIHGEINERSIFGEVISDSNTEEETLSSAKTSTSELNDVAENAV